MANGNKHLGEESKKTRKKRRGSQAPMFGAKGPETSGKRRRIKIGEAESDSVTHAPKATPRRKRGALELAGSLVGGPVAGKLLGKAAGALASRAAASKGAPSVIRAGAPAPQAKLPKPKTIKGTDQTSGPTIRAAQGDPSKGAIPAVRKSTTPAKTKPKSKTTSKDKGKIVGLSPLGKAIAGGTLGAGAIYGGTKLADNYYSKEAGATPAAKPTKKAKGSKNTVNKAPYVEGYDMDDFDSPKSVPSKSKAKPKAKAKKNPDFEYYGKEGTGLGDFSRKHGIQYATEEGYKKWFDTHDGEKKGGSPGKGKMKTQGMNRSKRSGFSGRGSGAALRGF